MQSIEEMKTAMPWLTHDEAVERYTSGVANTNKLIAEGRCTYCGVKGHNIAECELHAASEREIQGEIRRRSSLS